MIRRSVRLFRLPQLSSRSLTTQPLTTPPPTPLLLELHRRIRFHGPLTVAEYMRQCLLHPIHGYYTTTPTIFGPQGDFYTSPTLSAHFGELLAVFLAHHIPPPYTLIELGPGTASLLSSALPALRTLRSSPSSISLVDRSPLLRDAQKAALRAAASPPVSWFDSLEHALEHSDPSIPRVFLAHEFLDALPVHVFQREHATAPWRERLVDVAPDASDDSPRLRFVLAPSATPASALLGVFPAPVDATVTEVGAEAAGTVETMSRAVGESGGMALLVDYGGVGVGDTLRGFKKHQQVDVLAEPGRVDMTADVDFGHLRTAVERVDVDGVQFRGPVTQREFLLRLGAAARFRNVAQGVVERGERVGDSDDVVDRKLQRLQGEYDQLVGETEMGLRFKVAGIVKGQGDFAGGL